ncbi:hypothetical protein [Parashewanella tropica]|uniref:hypothetical protein n=1 Tax=Parashewanella tropica TaxID=2547970 RepID=UPI00105A9128|nr:hypothetical protein [Parashewanella tropica]
MAANQVSLASRTEIIPLGTSQASLSTIDVDGVKWNHSGSKLIRQCCYCTDAIGDTFFCNDGHTVCKPCYKDLQKQGYSVCPECQSSEKYSGNSAKLKQALKELYLTCSECNESYFYDSSQRKNHSKHCLKDTNFEDKEFQDYVSIERPAYLPPVRTKSRLPNCSIQ